MTDVELQPPFAARVRRVIVVLAGGAAAVLASSAAAGLVHSPPDYDGHFIGQPESRAHFDYEIKRAPKKGKRKLVVFQLSDLAFDCEDGVTRPQSFGSIGIRWRKGRTFYRKRISYQTDVIRATSVYEVKGRIMPRGKARGWITFEEDIQSEGFVDCNSNGRHRWVAKRVRAT